MLENMEGTSKVIKSQNTDEGAQIPEDKQKERKEAFEKIHHKIINSAVTHESETDQKAMEDLNGEEFIQQLEKGEPTGIESFLFYGEKQPQGKRRNVSIFDGSQDEHKGTEKESHEHEKGDIKEEKVTEKIHEFEDPPLSNDSPQHYYNQEDEGNNMEVETLDGKEENDKENSVTIHPNQKEVRYQEGGNSL